MKSENSLLLLWCAQYLIPANNNSQNLFFSQWKRFTLNKFTLWRFFSTMSSFFFFRPWILSELLTYLLKCRPKNWKQYSRLSFSNSMNRCKITFLFYALYYRPFNHCRGKQHTDSEGKTMITTQNGQMECAIEDTCIYSCLPAVRGLAIGRRLPCGFDCHVFLLPYRE